MLITLVAIETTGRSPRARRLRFDHAEPRLTSAGVVKLLGLAEGDEWDLERLDEAISRAEPELAKERAYRMLGYRERSASEVRQGLLDDGYSPSACAAVVSRLQELSLVDDERFARSWARARVLAGYDRRRIRRELEQRGVDSDLAEQALVESAPEDGALLRARQALRGRTASDRRERDKLVRRLVGKGFDLSTAIAAVESPGGSDPENEGTQLPD